jgi:chaperonin GroES
MITNGYGVESWQPPLADASPAVQTIDSQGLADKFPRWHSPEVSARHETGGTPMKVRPLQDRILVRRVAEEEKTKGGIIIPDTAKEKPAEGEVIAVGNGKVDEKGKLRALQVKKGDRVLFGKYSGNEIKIDGVDHLILREDDILGVLEK